MNIAVIYGGKSVEHDISIITGKQVAYGLIGHKVIEVYIDREGNMRLAKKDYQVSEYTSKNTSKWKKVCFSPNDNRLFFFKSKKVVDEIDVVIPALHGINGEDGSISGLVQLSNIPCVSSNIIANAVCIDKAVFKYFILGLGLDSLPFYVVDKTQLTLSDIEKIKNTIPLPYILKPSKCGSSIGIEVINSIEELDEGLIRAFDFDQKVVVEHALTDFYEVNCAVYKVKDEFFISKLERPLKNQQILSFEDKYVRGGKESSKRIFPYDYIYLNEVQEIAKNVYSKLNASGVMRFDFLVDNTSNNFYLCEANSIPGSFAYYLFGASITNLLEKLIENAIYEFKSKQTTISSFSSNVLNLSGKK